MITAFPNFTRCCFAVRCLELPRQGILRVLPIPQAATSSSSIKATFLRQYSQQDRKETSALAESKQSGEVSTATAFETVKETTKTAWNLGVILVGVGITGSIFWTIFSELFSSNSPNNIYSKALDRCIANAQVQDHLGEPIKGYGEETRRGRRRHVSHSIYEKDGRKHMLMKFYIQGTRKKGTVFVEMREDDGGTYQCNLLAVQLDDLLGTRIILEDNRNHNTVGKIGISPIAEETDLSNLH